jgi:glucose 1-dehydrogenase
MEPQMKGLQGKNVLVTGASSGIGHAIAIRFAEEGAHVAMNYRSAAELAEAEHARAETERRAAGGRVVLVQADVASEPQVTDMLARVIRELGRLDVLVNNAGVQAAAPSHQAPLDEFERVLGVNLRGPFLCSREAIRHFLSRAGSGVIVNNSSVHGIIPKPLYLSYSISKGGLDNLTRTLALEYAAAGIRVNAVGPGAVITPLNRVWTEDAAARALVESHIPMGRAADAAEIAAVVAFLASDEASYITGQTLFACGGLTLYPEFRTNWAS